MTFGDVVADSVSGDVRERVFFFDVAAALAHDESDFDFPIEFDRILRHHDVVVGADDAVGELVEQDRLGGDWHVGFGGVIGIVEADGDEVARLIGVDAGADADAFGCGWQRCRVDLAELVEGGRRQRFARNVRDMGGQVADGARSVD